MERRSVRNERERKTKENRAKEERDEAYSCIYRGTVTCAEKLNDVT